MPSRRHEAARRATPTSRRGRCRAWDSLERERSELADAILTCFADVTPAVIRAAPKLRVIGRYGIGVDNIAVHEATRRRIPVTNVPPTASTRWPSMCSL